VAIPLISRFINVRWLGSQQQTTNNEKEQMSSSKDFKDPFNIFYLLGFIAVLLAVPLLPATLTVIRVLNGYATF